MSKPLPETRPEDDSDRPTEFTAADKRILNIGLLSFVAVVVLLMVVEYLRTH